MTGRHDMWDGDGDVTVGVPTSGGENVMVPVIRGIVRCVDDPERILLQRRAGPQETVRGMLEIPGGRWRAAEPPGDAIEREVREEAGVELVAIHGIRLDEIDARRTIASLEPLVVVAGVSGAFPAIHVVLIADGRGTPRDEPGETFDVRWWCWSDVLAAIEGAPEGFIPSTLAALRAYEAWLAGPR
jgi:8-oxo-dGTP pyrophosphatase MutT (NUDIX family)